VHPELPGIHRGKEIATDEWNNKQGSGDGHDKNNRYDTPVF